MWNVLLNEIVDKKVKPVSKNPKQSGEYACTCIIKKGCSDAYHTYVKVMTFDAIRNQWHDIDNLYRISDTILAWKESKVWKGARVWKHIEACDFADFNCVAGTVFKAH